MRDSRFRLICRAAARLYNPTIATKTSKHAAAQVSTAGQSEIAAFWLAIGCSATAAEAFGEPEPVARARASLVAGAAGDLDSHTGTFLNGIPVKQRALHSGDEIAVGRSIFRLQAEESQSLAGSPVQMCEPDALDAKALEFQAPEFLSLDPHSLAALPQPAQMARNLSALLQICRAIGSLRDEASLPWILRGLIFDVIPAERGAILLVEAGSNELYSQVGWDRVSGPDHPVPVSRGIVNRVIEEAISLMHSPPRDGRVAGPAGNVRQRAFLCVPMMSEKKVTGLIYLESSSATTSFTEDDFQLLSAIAGLGVIGIEKARQFELLGSENQRLRAEVSLTHDMVGRSASMRDVYQFIERVAPTDSTVLIYGEAVLARSWSPLPFTRTVQEKLSPL
jgi:GAF domain